MKRSLLHSPEHDATFDEIDSLLSYDPDTGLLHWKIARGKRPAGRVAGCKTKRGYVLLHMLGHMFQGHRVCWLLAHGEWPTLFVDHFDENRSNNRLSNLRQATHQQNLWNCSKTKGYYFHRQSGLFGARININKKTRLIGYFKTATEARAAYLEATKIHFGEFSVTNRLQFVASPPCDEAPALARPAASVGASHSVPLDDLTRSLPSGESDPSVRLDWASGGSAAATFDRHRMAVADNLNPCSQHRQPKHRQSEQDCYNASHEGVS